MVFIYLYIMVSLLLVPYYYGLFVSGIDSNSYTNYFLNTSKVLSLVLDYLLIGLSVTYALVLMCLFYLIVAPIGFIIGVYSEKY